MSPAEATASYQWQICDTVNGTYTDISGETTNKYTPVASDVGKFIKVVTIGTGSYSGTVTSDVTTAVEAAAVVKTPITAISAITGTPKVNSTLTPGTLTPSEAKASYQWQRCSTLNGAYSNISGATENTYKLTLNDKSKYIRVVATGTGGYSGTVTSAPTVLIAAAAPPPNN